MNSRIRFPFNIFFLNPVYVAARSLRSNYKKALPKYVQQKQCFSPTQSPSERKYASSLTWFGHDSPAGQFVSVRSFLIATTT